MTEQEFDDLADGLRISWNGDRERWDQARESLTGRSMCMRWDGDTRLLLELHTSPQAALIAATYGKPQKDCVRSAVLLERNLETGRMETKEKSPS